MILFWSLESNSKVSYQRDFQNIFSHWNILEHIYGLKVLTILKNKMMGLFLGSRGAFKSL